MRYKAPSEGPLTMEGLSGSFYHLLSCTCSCWYGFFSSVFWEVDKLCESLCRHCLLDRFNLRSSAGLWSHEVAGTLVTVNKRLWSSVVGRHASSPQQRQLLAFSVDGASAAAKEVAGGLHASKSPRYFIGANQACFRMYMTLSNYS
jgi:hypothetical protein